VLSETMGSNNKSGTEMEEEDNDDEDSKFSSLDVSEPSGKMSAMVNAQTPVV
jgi:hypothetical protein